MPTVSRWWGSRSDPQRIALYTRWSYYSLLGVTPLIAVGVLGSSPHPPPVPAAVAYLAGTLAVTAACLVLARAGLADDRAARPWSTGLLAVAGGCTLATAVAGFRAVAAGDGDAPGVTWAVALPPLMLLTALSTVWTTPALVRSSAVVGALVGLAALADGVPAVAAGVTGVVFAATASAVAVAFRFSVWVLEVVREMDRSRGVQLQLAVAEERLRFARDLHDVMGRDLSTIAVKSQLAGELVRRGRPGAAEEVADISRIAEASLREVREVVRGYRTADLAGELAGARSVLRAAGVACTVADGSDGAPLPDPVHAALAWAVREAVTNVLRHSTATACTITLTVTGVEARLDVDNDGSRDGTVPWGNGLTGLAERLAGTGGRLAVRADGGRFCLTATVPVPR